MLTPGMRSVSNRYPTLKGGEQNMAYNGYLKMAIHNKGLTQQEAADKAEIQGSTLSMIIHGRQNATPGERKKIAQALNTPQKELFPEIALAS